MPETPSSAASPPKRVLFLMSDTGGGHRAAADAIRAAMSERYPDTYTFALVDVYRHYTPFPFNRLPELWPLWVHKARLTWKWGYALTNARRSGDVLMAFLQRAWARGLRRLVCEQAADVVVSVHALFSRPVMWAYRRFCAQRPPFVTVVTDLQTTHAFWYEPRVERCLVPTREAYARALRFGLRPAQVRLTGLPIHPQFGRDIPSRRQARHALGLRPTLPVVLLVGGGDGVGPVYPIARELDRRASSFQLVIVTGRNGALRARLASENWRHPTLIYPFVNHMAQLMAAADILVTKAGPTTIGEACTVGVPMVLSGAIPGQEDGNVAFVVEGGAGIYAPQAPRVADAVSAWLAEGPEVLGRLAARARALGRPDAVWQIAEEIHAQAQKPPLPTW